MVDWLIGWLVGCVDKKEAENEDMQEIKKRSKGLAGTPFMLVLFLIFSGSPLFLKQ